MNRRVLKNARVLGEDFKFVLTDLVLENGNIFSVGKTEETGEDLQGAYVVPGLVDIHTHGCNGGDHLDGSAEKTRDICRLMAEKGTTTVLATIMTQSGENMLQACRNVAACKGNTGGAHLRGIYLEGPFFTEKYKGAQHPDYLMDADEDFFLALQEASGNMVRIMSIAPDRPGTVGLIPKMAPAKAFMGHTDATYEQAKAAVEAGACGLTHTFNGMVGLHHRNPGVIAAAWENDNVICECICDGFHVNPAMAGLLYRQVGKDRFCVISDSLRPAGLPDGHYESGGQPVTVKDGKAYLEGGVIAGSTTFMLQEVQNLVAWGIMPLEDAVYCATAVPAKAAGIYGRCGSIAPGKAADILVLNEDLSLRETILGAE